MRTVRYQRLVPNSSAEQHEVELLSLIKTEGYLAMFVNSDKQLPPFEELNRVLASGSGDDGHFVMRWSPFTITEEEYAELANELKKQSK